MTIDQKLEQWEKAGPMPPYRAPCTVEPDMCDLEHQALDGVVEATDGCMVEPDGYCEHAHISWLLYLGYI
jgi:hypothetical protein